MRETSLNRTALSVAVAILLAGPGTAAAQREGYTYLSYVGSEVSLVSSADGEQGARANTPVLAGDVVSTGPSSRAEAILADGGVLRVDVRTRVRFDRLARTYEATDDRNAFFVERGAVSLQQSVPTTRDAASRIDTDDVTVLVSEKGIVRVDTGRRGTEVYVLEGAAEVNARTGRALLRAGEYAYVSGSSEIEVDAVDVPRDRFTLFVEERLDRLTSGSVPRYVNADYSYDYAASDFDAYGSWVWVSDVGSYCWRPTVGADWRPYTLGTWRWTPAGLTWCSYEPWGWLPYHYGTWTFGAGVGWCWSPGVVYSPAWVYWAYTPSWVGWCPMGYYGASWWRHGGHGGRYGHGGWNDYYHLRGPVDMGRVDPRGWNYVSVSRLGERLDPSRDIRHGEQVGFRGGERGLVATSPLRIERGRSGSMVTAVQDAVRRVPLEAGLEGRGSGRNPDATLTSILGRDRTLGPAATAVLDRSRAVPGRDPAYRPITVDRIASASPGREEGRSPGGGSALGREVPRGGTAGPPVSAREGAVLGGGFGSEGAGRGTPAGTMRDGDPSSGRTDPWRESSGVGPSRSAPSASGRLDTAGRREGDLPASPAPRDRAVPRGDDGWRSPSATTSPGFVGGSRGDRPPADGSERAGGTLRPAEPLRRSPAPAPETGSGRVTAPAPPSTAPALRAEPRSEGWRTAPPSGEPSSRPEPYRSDGWRSSRSNGPEPSYRGSAPPRDTSPRGWSAAPGSRPYTRPEPRPYQEPRSYSPPAPRSYQEPRSYSPPAPRSYSAPSPRSYAPPSAPRSYSAPSPRSYGAPSAPRSYSAPSAPRAAPAPSGGGRGGRGGRG